LQRPCRAQPRDDACAAWRGRAVLANRGVLALTQWQQGCVRAKAAPISPWLGDEV
jgi:hypothetical protein